MLFQVERSSNFNHTGDPRVAGAVLTTGTFLDRRLKTGAYEQDPTGYKTGWYQYGTNHREEGSTLIREIEKPVWFLEIGTLEELLALVDEYDEVVLSPPTFVESYGIIEIYDTCREMLPASSGQRKEGE